MHVYKNMEELKSILETGGHSLVVGGSAGIRTFDGRGISDLWRLYNEEPEALKDACIADKVIGKGAAALMALGGVKKVWTNVISRPALELLTDAGIETGYRTLTDNIINRAGTGICPVETLCTPCATPEECLAPIASFIENLSKKQ